MSNDKEIVGLALMIGSVCLLGWQVYEYLRYNIWTSVSVITALGWINVGWAFNPTDWLGLYNILIKMPLCLIMFVLGFFVLVS
jgi:hypothetical protein